MESDSLQKVKQGSPFKPKAADWNAFVDAALAHRGMGSKTKSGDSSMRGTADSGIVTIQNNSGLPCDQYTVLSLDTLLITPTDNESHFRFETPVFSGTAIASENISKPFAIIQEPLGKSFVGDAMVAGVSPAKIAVSDESHAFAELAATGLQSAASGIVRILWKESGTGSKWAVIHFPAGSGGGTGCLPAKIVSKVGGFYKVDVYANGFDTAATATNQMAKVLMLNYAQTLPADTEVIISSNYVASTGGGDVA